MTEAKMAAETKHVLEIYIRTTPEKLWQALTDGEQMAKYFFGQHITFSDWSPGSVYYFKGPDGQNNPAGTITEADPLRKLVNTLKPGPDASESRLTWEITPAGESCKLTLIHDQLDVNDPMSGGFKDGWVMFFSAIKTWLETGEILVLAPPADCE